MVELLRDSCLIDGAWLKSDTRLEVINPADGALVGSVPLCGADETRLAIAAADRAFPAWAARPAIERADILQRFFALMVRHEDELARLLTSEQGKPLAEAVGEIRYAASFLRWFAEEGRRAYGEIIPANQADRRIMVLRQPIGVVAAITPWNFPAAMVTRKVAPALAAGCTVILKPAEQTPLTALALGALAMEAGVPAGVLNIVTGDARAIGQELTSSPVVRKLTFTGSTDVGALLYGQCAPTIKKLSLELGGNAPFIVFDDADLDEAVEGAIAAKFRNAGQTCVCANRFIVQDSIHDRFVAAFARRASALKVGRGDDPVSQIGPLIDDDAAAKVASHVADAVAQGAIVHCGGSALAEGSRFFLPTVLSLMAPDMRACQEETFGPVAPVIRFATEQEAIAIANATQFGLAAYVYTNDLRCSWRMAERLEAGMVGINTGNISTEVSPFGGVKSSGLSREGSRHGLDDYLELKTVILAS